MKIILFGLIAVLEDIINENKVRSVDSILGNNLEINIVVSSIIINIKYAQEYPNSISKIN